MGDQVCSERAVEGEQRTRSMEQDSTESLPFEEINGIPPEDFMSTFLNINIDSQLVAACERIFSLQEGSDIPLEWQEEMKKANQYYRAFQGEIEQYEHPPRIIALVLERATMKQFASTFSRFMASLEFAVQYREAHEEESAYSLVPELPGSAAIKGI